MRLIVDLEHWAKEVTGKGYVGNENFEVAVELSDFD